jgi:transposase
MRILAVQAVLAGERPSAVMSRFGLCRTTVYKWLRTVEDGGLGALAPRRHPGRAPRLPPASAAQVQRWVLGRTPSDHGIPGPLWTRPRIAALVRARCGVDLRPAAVGRLLRRIGLDPRPARSGTAIHRGAAGVLFCHDGRGAFLCHAVRRESDVLHRAIEWLRERSAPSLRLAFRPDPTDGPPRAGV